METLTNNQSDTQESSARSFIEGPTVGSSLEEIKNNHLIPVFKDGVPVISHSDFIEAAYETISNYYPGEVVLKPAVRLSHPIEGRKPEARNKPVQYLEPQDKTIYWDRMAFVVEVPTISNEIEGEILSLTVGGIKAYNMDHLHSNKTADQKFKIFVGLKVKVCSNLALSLEGVKSDIKVNSLGQLQGCIKSMLENYNANYHIHSLKRLVDFSLTEKQVAQFVGRCRLYQHLPLQQRSGISPLLINDSQINTVVKEYYRGPFSRDDDGSINLWKIYNLLTESAKSSYLDTFIEKTSNAFQITEELKMALENKATSWFLN